MIKVHVGDRDYGMGVGVFIVNEPGQGEIGNRMVMKFGPKDVGPCWEAFEPMTQLEPTFMLEDEIARVLLEALTRHYHGADDARQLRKDYEAERARVDKFINAMIK